MSKIFCGPGIFGFWYILGVLSVININTKSKHTFIGSSAGCLAMTIFDKYQQDIIDNKTKENLLLYSLRKFTPLLDNLYNCINIFNLEPFLYDVAKEAMPNKFIYEHRIYVYDNVLNKIVLKTPTSLNDHFNLLVASMRIPYLCPMRRYMDAGLNLYYIKNKEISNNDIIITCKNISWTKVLDYSLYNASSLYTLGKLHYQIKTCDFNLIPIKSKS